MVGREYGRIYAWDTVNSAMVRQWCEVMGVDNPLYTDPEYAATTEFGEIVAPPAMLQAWCLEGLHMNNYPPGSTEENPYEVLSLIEAQGYPAVVAVNSELTFDRYVRMGEKLYYTTLIKEVSEEKTTALGTGFFVTQVMSFFSEKPEGDEKVGELMFRVIKFKPANQPKPVEKANPRFPRSSVPSLASVMTPVSSGKAARRASCAFSSARAAKNCSTRQARCAVTATALSWTTSSARAAVSCTPCCDALPGSAAVRLSQPHRSDPAG